VLNQSDWGGAICDSKAHGIYDTTRDHRTSQRLC
jgi:hypothetical protein